MKIRRPAAAVIAHLRALEFDDIGAVIAQQHGAKGPGHGNANLYYAQPLERLEAIGRKRGNRRASLR
jgi:hypothetical protein